MSLLKKRSPAPFCPSVPAPVAAHALAHAVKAAEHHPNPLEAFIIVSRVALRCAYSLGIFGGCTYLVFWRGESGWLYLLACVLMWFRRGI